MSEEETETAQKAWREVWEAEKETTQKEEITEETEAVEQIRNAMRSFMRVHLKWTERELHDALLALGHAAPEWPSMLEYFKTLHHQLGDPTTASFAQNAKSHTKAHLKDVLQILARTGVKLGGLSGTKQVLAERLARVLSWVTKAGRQTPSEPHGASAASDAESDSSREDTMEEQMFKRRGQPLIPRAHAYGEVPDNANIDPTQAESALGRNQATEEDADAGESPDQVIKKNAPANSCFHENLQHQKTDYS